MSNSEHKSKSNAMPVVALTMIVVAAGAFYTLRANRGPSGLTAAPAASVQHPALLHLEPFVLNLPDDDHTYLRVGIDLSMQAPAVEAKKNDKVEYPVVIARDTILALLSTRHANELATAEDKQRLKKDLKEALNARTPELGVREVYFTEFLLQR